MSADRFAKEKEETSMQSIYDREAVKPMWQELAQCGVTPLTTVEEVDTALAKPGTTLVVINSICGCAAGNARPGVTQALQGAVIPDQLTTVFAGVDREATEHVRSRMPGIMPSSPCVALFRDGTLVYALERRHIERMSADDVAGQLANAFSQYCSGKGPSVAPEIYQTLAYARQCGSQIPRLVG
jgi:putative YphP/YqiW family bacilliredoxin